MNDLFEAQRLGILHIAAEVRGLLDELGKLSVPDAAARIRVLLGSATTPGVVS